MYNFTWPGTLPAMPGADFTETGGVNIIRSPVDAGPAKQRKRGSKPQVMQMSFTMSPDQIIIFENFVKATLNGISRFGFPHPRLGTVVEVRIVPQSSGDLYSISYINPMRYNVSLQMEILP